ncbi:uncharacterized protein VICG_01147 [Vittaforma corneae ATCC 50505]|uniref:Asparagine synthetase domain-containing protein n=1 Tax=Vittaforma corneae (strain ATCC 50505) TaxID=993615 RepID=L2GMR3_VITCO|nr:uncharacterized protein VICG_01147 [Vittaforma corneae ATCC 50505]ELA41795.1 hypothetical protein VICG_01147 [Vittaforma corneae ATCC 50505]
MCGIYLSEVPSDEEIKYYIACRGKDFQSEAVCGNFHLFSSVLSIRSSVPQPFVEFSFTFLYNGEIYNDEESDTLFIARAVKDIRHKDTNENVDGINGAFTFVNELYKRLKGHEVLLESEFALVITDGKIACFFKDDVGKRSLGYRLSPFTLSSVNYDIEVDPMKFYIYDSSTKKIYWRLKEQTGIVREYLNRMGSIKEYLFSEKYKKEYSFLTEYENIITSNTTGMHQADISLSPGPGLCRIGYVSVLHSLLESSFKTRRCYGNPVIFFSGGIDSLILAIYTHLTMDSEKTIYLINTATEGSFDCIQGIKSYQDLQSTFPNRNFVFVENNLKLDEIKKHRAVVKYLMHPKKGWMDFNIASVLYFTAMCASAYGKVVYLGSGADEIFGGYNKYINDIRDRNTVKYSRVRSHMLFDLFTISAHNIARDDRAISHWNVEARFPLLDYKIIEFSLSLPTSCFIDERFPENKAILRNLLRFHGFDRAAGTPKKAMQYGTGMSRYESQILP